MFPQPFEPLSCLVLAVRAVRRVVFVSKAMGRVAAAGPFIVGPRARLARGISIDLGHRVSIGADLVCQVDLSVGDDVMISSGVAFIGDDHEFGNPQLSIRDQPDKPRSRVRVEGDNLIGYGTIVLGNVTVGHGTIVGAGSLVTRDLPPNMVCVGRPARPVRPRR